MDMLIIAVCIMIAAIVSWLITRASFLTRLRIQEELHGREMKNAERMHRQTQENYEKALKEMKETVITRMSAETESLLKKREKELSEENVTSIDGILKPLKESIEAMQKAMKANENTHVENTTRLSAQLEQAVKEMKEKTSDVGKKADSLSDALTGRPKVQGCFGESYLNDILVREGLKEGVHYVREEANEDKSRPDFVFHFKDGFEEKDLIVDSKVSLTAFVDYRNASTEEEKNASLDRHVKSVQKHIDELCKKEYAKKNRKSFADYVVMFMPIEMAFRIALEAHPMLWQEAYQKNVLIVTDQTIMPFLKIVQLTWNKYRHDTRVQEITQSAQNMLDRVSEFYSQYTNLGNKVKELGKIYNDGAKKLCEGRMSITTSAKQVINLGGKLSKGKELKVPEEIAQIGELE